MKIPPETGNTILNVFHIWVNLEEEKCGNVLFLNIYQMGLY